MKVHSNAREFSSDRPVVLTIGTFDGVHAGHRAVLDLLKQRAEECGGDTVLLTFDPHPRKVLQPDQNPLRLLNTLEEKKRLLMATGLNHLVVQEFTEELSRKTPLEYVRELFAEGIKPAQVIVGYDHRFGRNREGSFDSLVNLGRVFGFTVEELPAQTVEDTRVSSTKVREAIAEGQLGLAQKWLKHPYPMSGIVVRGEQLGRKLGYPTANLAVDHAIKLIPGQGVYAAWAQLEGEESYLPAMVNIGTRPTVTAIGSPVKIEVHLLSGGRQCYDERLSVLFVERLRDEMTFDGLKGLTAQLHEDEHKARAILNNPSLNSRD